MGKIFDIFAGKGITKADRNIGNPTDMEITDKFRETDFNGLCFTNLVDFDMQYGHRRDPQGYANALNEFDRWFGEFIKKMLPEDAVIITADHGCDPCHSGTDHTREYIPVLVYGENILPKNLGTRSCFGDIGATVLEMLGVTGRVDGESFAREILK